MTIKRLRFISLALFAVLFASGAIAGYWLAGSLHTQGGLAYRARQLLAREYVRLMGKREPEQTVVTNRVTLKRNVTFLPVDVPETSGGMTTIDGTSLLIVDRLGGFHHVQRGVVTPVRISPPDNHVAALRTQLEAGQFGKSQVNFAWMRYTDVLHVRHAGRAWLIVSYTEWHPEEKCFTTTLARLEVPAGQPPGAWTSKTPWEVVARTQPCLRPFTYEENSDMIMGLEAGGRLAVLDGARIAWTTGSYERDDRHHGPDYSDALGQSESGQYGRVLEVDFLSGQIRELAKGLRNPQGISVDAQGRIWVTDHGMRGGDELNLVTEGANFGYPAVTYGVHYDGKPAVNSERHGNHDGYTKPVVAFVPSIGTGCVVAIEGVHYAWNGDLLICSMSNGALYRAHVEDGRAMYVEQIGIGIRPRDMAILKDGTVAVWTDNRRVLFFKAEAGAGPAEKVMDSVAAQVPAALRQEVTRNLNMCWQCHSLAKDQHGMGPSLHEVCGRPLAATGFNAYSPALRQKGGAWTAERLTAYLANPQAFVPGTTMAWNGAGDEGTAAQMVRALCN